MVLTLNVPTNGTFFVTTDRGGQLNSGNSLTPGVTLTLHAIPAPGYVFGYWKINGCYHYSNPYTYTVTTCNVTISVKFTRDCVKCFLADAPVLTPSGYRAIGSLEKGDVIMTSEGGYASIHAVKKQNVVPSEISHPYVIPRGRFGAIENICISPHHQVKVGDRYIEARFLGLESKIMKKPFQYYNLELVNTELDMVVAGVVVETWSPWDGVERTAEGSLQR